jgi:UDP-N-acetylglucosamine--N-acetylmuramyl-(pentapeptide) pyrophosphoryl-undecaprenol N-acetylglucosamine transferase
LDAANSFALIVPLPIGNGEQRANAADLVEKGAAEICSNSEFNPTWLLSNIDELIYKAEQWAAKRSPNTEKPAAEVIGQLVLTKLAKYTK